MGSPRTCDLTISENCPSESRDSSEQLHLPLHDEGRGIPPFRLLESVSSLHLTPFAAKAVRGTGLATVGDLAAFVFNPTKDCRSLGQGHIEEIQRKIELFVGKPPYQYEQCFDFVSLLRLLLSEIESNQRAIIVSHCELQKIFPLSSQEMREAENSLTKDKERKFQQSVEAARHKTEAKLSSLLEITFRGLVYPWMIQRGSTVHERELTMFLFEAQPTRSSKAHTFSLSEEKGGISSGEKKEDFRFLEYHLFEKGICLLNLIANTHFLFARHLCLIEGKSWALTSQDRAKAQAILQDAATLIGKGKEGVSLKALAKAVEECRFEQWDPCAYASIERLLFWHFLYK